MWPLIAGGVVIASAAFGTAWQLQELTITQIKLEATNEHIASQRVARIDAEKRVTSVLVAQNNATVSAIKLRADVAGTVTVGNGLRIQTTTAVRTAASDPSLCSDTAIALGELFNDSSQAYVDLAEQAQRHIIDIQALIEREAK